VGFEDFGGSVFGAKAFLGLTFLKTTHPLHHYWIPLKLKKKTK
jgi:hypothetical protein